MLRGRSESFLGNRWSVIIGLLEIVLELYYLFYGCWKAKDGKSAE
jgi:hypothetical protein